MTDVETSTIAADDWFAQSAEAPDCDPQQQQQQQQTSYNGGSATTGNVTVGTRRQANGTIGSVYSGNKIKHLKKEDGIPLWRKDIQYEFLRLVFEDKSKVFTRQADGQREMDFADIYMDAMARSSKTSKILKDKLQNDKPAAISMAMVCLLVNFGRMNTTLNFFPEMRAQLRTYHSIPSLQAHQDPNAYKQLQDAPRLKSILKGASEDVDQPNTLEKIKEMKVPRTNPVNLIFVLAQYAPKVSEMHFFPPRDFFDLVMRSTLSSASRARAFLWLMWWYLESDFTREAALNNPFGAGQDGEETGGLPIKVPNFESLTEEQADAENIDTQEESEFGEVKRLERKRILEEEEPLTRVYKRSRKGDYYDDDQDSGDLSGVASVRGDRFSFGGPGSGVSTPMHPSVARWADEDDGEMTPSQSARATKRPKREDSLNRSVGQQRLVLKTKGDQTPDASSPAPPATTSNALGITKFVNETTVPNPSSNSRRPRPLTQHQIAVEQNRRDRIRYLLAKRKEEAYQTIRTRREHELPFARYGRLLQNLPDGYDTDDETQSWGKGGLLSNPRVEDDYGECASYFLSVIRKATRRLDRWDYEDANGPKRDRRKEREERHRARQEALAFDNALDIGGGRIPSARSRARAAARNAKRKAAADEAAATPTAAAAGQLEPTSTPTAARPKNNRSRTKGAAATAAAKKLDVELTPHPNSAPLGEDDEGLDDIDRELLGEASGDEPDAHAHHSRPPVAASFEESFVGEEAVSSDVDADEEDMDEGEGDVDENSSTFEGRNGEGASEAMSAAGAGGEDEGIA